MLSIKLSENGGKAPEAVPYMPAGLNHICCTVNGKAGKRAVMADQEACARLQADLKDIRHSVTQASASGTARVGQPGTKHINRPPFSITGISEWHNGTSSSLKASNSTC